VRDENVMVSNGDVNLSTRVVGGGGPLVILMHGWPDLALSWRHQLRPLAEAGYTVAAPDMRGYGESSKPTDVAAYALEQAAGDMAAIARALGARRWVAVGHDWGAAVAWRCALRYPDEVAAVFGMSVPHNAPPPGRASVPTDVVLDHLYPDTFVYPRYFQEVGAPEAELERDVRAALKQSFFSLSGDAPAGDWTAVRPPTAGVLDGLTPPPPGPLSFMPDDVLDQYAAAFEAGGFFGPLSWYRNFGANAAAADALGDQVIRQPAGWLVGDKEIVTAMFPGTVEAQRRSLADLRVEVDVRGGAGHWVQQERPEIVTQSLLGFLADVGWGR